MSTSSDRPSVSAEVLDEFLVTARRAFEGLVDPQRIVSVASVVAAYEAARTADENLSNMVTMKASMMDRIMNE